MAGFDAEGAALAVADALRAVGTAERAIQEKRYLKSELEFFGVAVPEMRRVVTGAVRGHPGVDGAGMVAWAVSLWGEPVHERRMAALEILTVAAPRLSAAELAGLRGR
jgi:DNA alkylation repair enzyme